MRLPLALWGGIPTAKTCPNCGKPGVLFDAIGRGYFGCRHCLYYRVEPLPTEEEVAAYYEKGYSYSVYNDLSDSGYLERAKRLMRLLRCDIPGRVLEIGPAGGGFIAGLSMLGVKVQGIDISKDVADNLARRFGVPCISTTNTVKALRNLHETYDLIVLNHVLEHLIDPFSILKEVGKLLSPSGECFIGVPNAFSAEAILYGNHWIWLDPIGHIHNWSPKSMRQMIAGSGLRVVREIRSFKKPTIRISKTTVIQKAIGMFGMGPSCQFVVRNL